MKIRMAALTTLLVLGACGGGTMSGSSTSASVSVAASGVITAFGSVFINGVRYDVAAARLQKNGRSVTQSALAVGEVAVLHGTQDRATGQGSAESVDVEDNVVGPVADLVSGGNTFTVLGQKVLVTSATSFAPSITTNDISGVNNGDQIEVSGLVGADGTITATRIAKAEPNEPMQVLGTVGKIDSGTGSLTINALNVDFSKASPEGFTTGHPASGDLIVVRGTQFDAKSMTLTATSVRPAETERSAAGTAGRVEQEGFITRFGSVTDFDVEGAAVITTDKTIFEGGVALDLAKGVRVEVRGTMNTSNQLVADVVEINHVAAIALEATVDDISGSTLKILGVSVTVDATTRFEDKSSNHLQMFALKDLGAGERVLVRGYESPAGSGTLLARRLERLAPGTEVEVRGPFATTAPAAATATAALQFQVFGITIDATTASFGGVEDHKPLTSADFLTQAVGQIVEVHGTATAGTVNATQVNIDHEEDR
jgi:hypothetical protein